MAAPPVPAAIPVAGPTIEPSGPRTTGFPPKPRRVRRGVLIAVAVIVILSVVLAAFYLETRPVGSTDVSVDGVNLQSNYTNAPAGQMPATPFDYYVAWFNATSESPSVTSIQAPAGSVVRLSLQIDDDRFFLPGVPVNCSVNGIVALSPFAIASLEAQFRNGSWNAHPFPLNFSGESYFSNPPALLMLNVTLPSQNGAYTPEFVLDITCEQYG
jgi:hypothetical protein